MLQLFKQKSQIITFLRMSILAAILTGLLLGGATVAQGQEEAQKIELDGSQYSVTYDGRTYDSESNRTTFTYTVQVNEEPALGHFTVQFSVGDPPSALVAFSSEETPTIGLDPTTGIDGIKWDEPLQVGQSRAYSFTLEGNIAEGPVAVAVKAGDFAAIGERPGPALGEGPASDTTSTETTTEGSTESSEATTESSTESSETGTEGTTAPAEETTQDTGATTNPATESGEAAAPATEDQALPQSGAILPGSGSAASLVLAGLVLVLLVGAGAITAVADRE